MLPNKALEPNSYYGTRYMRGMLISNQLQCVQVSQLRKGSEYSIQTILRRRNSADNRDGSGHHNCKGDGIVNQVSN